MARLLHTTSTAGLLNIFLDCPQQPRYGYQLCQTTGYRGGKIYPMLRRLVDHGFLTDVWEPTPHAGRPARRMYRLAGHAGAQLARQYVAEVATRAPKAERRRRARQASPGR